MDKIRNIIEKLVALTVRAFEALFGGKTTKKAKSGDIIPGEYLVVLNPSNDLESLTGQMGIKPFAKYSEWGFASKLTREQSEQLNQDSRVKFIEPNRLIMIDPLEEEVSDAANFVTLDEQPKQKVPSGIKRIDAHLSKTAKIDGVDDRVDVNIAIIDTGIQLDHPELNVVNNVTFVEGTKSGADDHGHGTHCAGIAAAIDNGTGVVGVAPGAKLWAVKVLSGKGSGTLAGVVSGIDYVTKNADKIQVANMSLGGEFKSDAIDEALAKSVAAGVTYAVAAGNSSKDAKTFSPANHPDVICVSAIADYDGVGGGKGTATCRDDKDDTLAGYSNFGEVVDIAAPGTCITSTWIGSGEKTISGTSMASPHVAGACGLVKATNKSAKPAEVKKILLDNGKAQSDPQYGFKGDPDKFAEPLLNVGSL